MPSRDTKTGVLPDLSGRLCIFGDSHLGSIKTALDCGMVGFPDSELSYYGLVGPQFRMLDMHAGRIHPRSAAAAKAVAQVAGAGAEVLNPDHHDAFLFYGARLRSAAFLVPFLHRAHHPALWQSRAALEIAAERWLISTRAFRFAAAFAAMGKRVAFIPAPLFSEGPGMNMIGEYDLATRGGVKDRDVLWDAMITRADAHNVTLLRQPEDTITGGCFTKASFAVDGMAQTGDAGHKSPAFAARWVSDCGAVMRRKAA